MNAPDWEAIDQLSMTSDATHVRGAPIDPAARRLWAVPVVMNRSFGADVGLIVALGRIRASPQPVRRSFAHSY